jgi:voltage-gated potassium channel
MADTRESDRERSELIETLDEWLEWPLTILAIVWLALLVLELVHGLTRSLELLGYVIWAIFIADFLVRLVVVPDKRRYLRRNWITAIALLLPALRVLRIARLARALRGVRFARIVGSLNRGMRSLGAAMSRRGLPYVLAITLVVLLTGAAGIYAFENGTDGPARSYLEALWWTAMLLTTIGSDYWPRSPEGKALTLLLSLYALGILGYVAASLASFFIGREAEDSAGSIPGERDFDALRAEIAALREQLMKHERPPEP